MNRIDIIQPNKASALIVLGTTRITDGELYKIRYINSFGHLDCLVALGIGDGIGPDYYTILSDRGTFLVSSIVSSLPDISEAVFGAVYLLVNGEGVWRAHMSKENGWEKEEVLGDHIITCVSDSGLYLLSDGDLQKLSDTLTPGQDKTEDIIDLQTRLAKLEKLMNTETIFLQDYSKPTKDLVITPGLYDLTTKKTLTSKSLAMRDSEIGGNQSLTVESPDINLSRIKVSGTWDRKGSSGVASGNAMLKFYSPEKILIDDLEVTKTSGYNGLEFGLDGKGTLQRLEISGLNFESSISNNAILIFSTADDAEIYIHDCHFSDVSNVLRLSNATGATNVRVVLKNITVDNWDTNPLWAGLVILEDYITQGKENLFGPDNITIVLDNVVGPWGKITAPDDIASLCPDSEKGREDGRQVFYVYHDNGKNLPYDPALYPNIIIE